MTKEELKEQEALIIQTYGRPEYDMTKPANESALKIAELRQAFREAKSQELKNKKLANEVKALTKDVPLGIKAVNSNLLRPEYLASFNEKQKRIINQWVKNIEQTDKEIADALNLSTLEIKAVMSLDAFVVLQRRLSLALIDTLPLSASLALRECLECKTDSVKLNAIKLILVNAGMLKDTSNPDVQEPAKVFDKETEDKLRDLGERLRKADS